MDVLEGPIIIYGQPQPQGSKNVSRHGYTYESNKKLRPWRDHAEKVLTDWVGTFFGAWAPLDEPIEVEVVFYVQRPARPRFTRPAVKPDLDKLQRALGDALTNAGVVKDDSRIVCWVSSKEYGEPRTVIKSIKRVGIGDGVY